MSAREWFGFTGMMFSAVSCGAFLTGRTLPAFAMLAVSFWMLQVLKKWKPKP